MDLAQIKKLTDRIRESNGGRRPILQELHRAILREAKSFHWEYHNTDKMRELIAKISKPGYEPTLLELYILKEVMGISE